MDWRVKAQTRSAREGHRRSADRRRIRRARTGTSRSIRPASAFGRRRAARSANSGSTRASRFTFPADAVPVRVLSIRLSPSIAGSLFGALEYLTSFPYGCVEQTMSSFLPNIMVDQSGQRTRLERPDRSGRSAAENRKPVSIASTASSTTMAAGDGGRPTRAIRS